MREAVQQSDTIAAVHVHYRSAMQMLMRNTLGSDRRTTITQQIEHSGPAELASLASFAGATKDMDLGAALCARNAAAKVSQRPFSSSDLADVLLGDEFRKVSVAISEIQIVAQEIVNADRMLLTRRGGGTARMQVALARQAQ